MMKKIDEQDEIIEGCLNRWHAISKPNEVQQRQEPGAQTRTVSMQPEALKRKFTFSVLERRT
jgi:hypothetical protein